MKVVTVEQMRAIEKASDAAGHTYAAMMERAGRAVAQVLTARQDVRKKRVLILVGPGNNGGDGLVAARYLVQAGAEVACYLTRARDPQGDENFRRLQDLSVFCLAADGDPDTRRLQQMAAKADVIIDALLGTGATPPLKGVIAEVLRAVGEVVRKRATPSPPEWVRIGSIPEPAPSSRPLIVAVDGPSGMDFDTGALDDATLPADLTVTFAYPKRGHFRFPAAGAVGELVVADIGTDPALAADVDLEVVTPEMVRGWLPPRPPDAHKGTFGRALIVAGSANYTGAARLVGAAAVRAGAGLVTVALPASIHSAVAATLSEATYLLLPHELGVLAEPAVEVLAEHAGRYDAMLLGPGLSQEKETAEFLEVLLRGLERRQVGFLRGGESTIQPIPLPPLVVDADGLNLLAKMDGWPSRLPPNTILTPHPGEMARLAKCSIADVQADRVEFARRKAREWGHVVVLKGAFTVVAAPDGRVVLEPFANPALATGGTGDVLAGIIVALRAQGMGPWEAAAAGAYLHGLTGELARQRLGTAGVAAGDLPPLIPEALRRIRNF